MMFTPYFVMVLERMARAFWLKTSGRRSICRRNTPGYNRNLDKLYVLKDFRVALLEEQADESLLEAASIDDDSIMDELNLIRSLSHPFVHAYVAILKWIDQHATILCMTIMLGDL